VPTVGSRFPDDVSELQLVQQINRVKTAMAKGRTIVLVNHDNIYEALYECGPGDWHLHPPNAHGPNV
jgi:hypothetical protein